MRIAEVTWRHRNDFHFTTDCRHCGKKSRWTDGYADELYCLRVIPARHCPHCGLNEYGARAEAPVQEEVQRVPEDGEAAELASRRAIAGNPTAGPGQLARPPDAADKSGSGNPT